MDFTSIHNYYEHLVIDYIRTEVIPDMAEQPTDFFLDVACYALCNLPARYVRYEIDMAFYMETEERVDMNSKVKKAVDAAVEYILENFNKYERTDD